MNLSQTAGTAAINAVAVLLNNGSLVFYSGAMPATPETALSGNTVLATFNFSPTAFGAPALNAGQEQVTASFANSSVTAAAGGTATFARAYKSDGTTVVADFTIGTSGADINLASTTIVQNTTVSLTSLKLGEPVV